MRINPEQVRSQVEALKLLYPAVFEDEEAWELTLDSETELDALLAQLVSLERQDAALAGAVATQIADLESRLSRFERRGKVRRELIFKLMQAANVRKRELPAATLSIRQGQERVHIEDEAAVPEEFCRIKREANRSAIKELLKSGVPFNWASLQRGEETLSVRVK